MYKLVFYLINPNFFSHNPKSFLFSIFYRLIKIMIFFKKKNLIIKYNLSKDLYNLKFNRYDFIAFKTEDLMNLEELIMIKYYSINKKKYKNFYDLGANIGLHSIAARKLGYTVKSYEPDFKHFNNLKKNCKLNKIDEISLNQKAVYDKRKILKFVEVKNNTTANHIIGHKKNLYGPIKIHKVQAITIKNIIKPYSLVKMDIEGSEYKVLKSLKLKTWNNVDCIVSIHNKKISKKIFTFFKNKNKIKLFSSLSNWKIVRSFANFPKSHADGILFISTSNNMNWIRS